MIIIMQLQLKQQYLLSNNPQKVSFEEQRRKNFEQLLVLITTTDRKKWLSTGFNCGSLIESYKQVYGLTSQQFQLLITIFTNIGLKEEGLSTETRVFVLKAVNAFTQFQIKITKNFKLSNKKIIDILQSYATEGVEGTLKNTDAVVDELSKFAFFFSRFGEQVVEEALSLSIEYNDIRYLIVFIRSLKTQASALRLLAQLFSDNNLWDRDNFWFFILSQIVRKFPNIDYSSYYHTIMQQTIRIFTTLIQPDSQDSLKKIVASDPFLQIHSIIKSVALILAYLLLPQSNPQHVFIKSCIQRLFNLVITSLDYINPPEYINDLLGFIKSFVRAYLLRYRSERGLFTLFNEDTIDDYHELTSSQIHLIDESTEQFFDNLWSEIIPKIVFYEDPQECKPSKIIAELTMYKPQKFLELSLRSILAVVSREDPTLISLHGAKISILFLQQYVIVERKQYLSLYIECCVSILGAFQKLGVSDNLDILQLVLRSFIYLDKEQINLTCVQNMVEDLLELILTNIQSISAGLQGTQDGQQLYISLSNIFFPFFLQLEEKQVEKFTQKFIYKLTNKIPEHQEAYKLLSVVISYINDQFPCLIIKHILKQLISQKSNQGEQINGEGKSSKWKFVKEVKGVFHAKNEQTIKWHASLLQCLIQYHPKNIVQHWNSIETIINLLLIQWQDQSYLEIALDILYNVILCLCKSHLNPKEFTAKHNQQYRTLKLNWLEITSEIKQLIDYIYDVYFVKIQTYLRDTYDGKLSENASQVAILADFQKYFTKNHNQDVIRIRNRNLKLVNFVLMPDATNPQHADDRKSIYRAISIQYTVISALMTRVPFHSEIENVGNFFTEDKYRFLRKRTCEYLQWVLQLLGYLNVLGQESFVKIFNYFWRQSHDEVSFSAAIDSTNEKITPFFYPQIHRRKEILRSSFLIVNEAYLAYMARLQFYLILNPTAHLNNPKYLESNFILGLNPLYQPNLHSYFPPYVEVHQYHRELIAICRYHLDPNNTDGYLNKLLNQTDPGKKQRYSTAVKALIISVKKLLNVFSDSCCMQDEFIRNTIFEIISLFRVLEKKIDKTLIYELVYVMLVFSFDPLCLQVVDQYPLTRYWSLKLQNSPQLVNYEVASIVKVSNLESLIAKIENTELQILQNMNNIHQMRLTRSCSFEHDLDITRQLERAITYLIKKMQMDLSKIQKDFGIYLLMLLLYSNSIPIQHPLIAQIMRLIFKLCQEQSQQIFNMSKSGLFHLVNRLNFLKRKSSFVQNTPVRRPWQQFLKIKYIGGESQNYDNLKCQKSQANFYPCKKLLFCQYERLAQDQSSLSFKNQQVLMKILQDQEGLLKFLKNCSKDPELKQNDQQNSESMNFSEQDFKSVSSSAHKLMHFIWDCNPSKTPLFMGVLERYQNCPLNFYNRFFRKVLRITGTKTRDILIKLANSLRKGQNEQIRLSFYISCQLMLNDPENQIHKPFLDYLGQCTNDNFDYALMGIYGILTSNLVIAEKNYKIFLDKLRTLKGACRFRHFDLLNTYMISQGRFARGAAIEATELLLKGINEGSDQISEAVVSMITQVYVQAVNLKNIGQWVQQPLSQLLKQKKIYILNEYVGYNDEEHLVLLLTQLMKNAKNQEIQVESTKLRIYSQIVRKILASIAIFRFNDYFYKLLRQLILYVLQRPQALEDDGADQFVISQLCDSQYPQDIYKDLVEQLLPMKDRTPYVIKKKLLFLQGLIIHRSFRLNKVQIPQILSKNEKIITYDYIIMISNIARLMKSEEITEVVQNLLSKTSRKKHETYKLITLLMAAGVRQYDWKQRILRDLVKHKKDKLVKECISQWWKGKTPQTQEELRLSQLVRNFENPYSYFA